MNKKPVMKPIHPILFILTLFIFSLSVFAYDIPDYNGQDAVTINNNVPEDLSGIESGLHLSELDSLGRCGVATGLIEFDTLAREERGSIGHIKPSGWHQNKYPSLVNSQPPYLYNRCHLIAFMFFGNETNEERNLITGTRHFNADTMLEYENMIVRYVEDTQDSVYYRVTPYFDGDNLVAKGVLMEAQSKTKDGLNLCVFCYNVQNGVHIDYATGENWEETGEVQEKATENTNENASTGEVTFIANKNSGVFHLPTCESVEKMKEKNKKELTCTRDEAIAQGYTPCKSCNP